MASAPAGAGSGQLSAPLAPALSGALAALAGLAATALACRWPHRPSLAAVVGARSRARTLGLVLTAALTLVVVWAPPGPGGWLMVLTGGALIYLALVDLRRFVLPWAGLAVLAIAVGALLWLNPTEAATRLATGGAVGLLFALMWRLPTRGRRLIGGGDVVLAGLVGALADWQAAPPVLAAAALAPLVAQMAMGRRGPVPFGFWLCLAALPAVTWNGWTSSPPPL